MANPRQRRKARSSSHKPVSHSKRAKKLLKKMPPIRGPKILQDAWDEHKTVKQNYAALGLIHTLNPSASGGSEPIEITGHDEAPAEAEASTSSAASAPAPIPKGYGRIIRDEDGNVLRVELADDAAEEDEDEDMEKDMEELAPEVDGRVLDKWVTELGGGDKSNGTEGEGNVVRALERISIPTAQNGTTLGAPLSGAGPRHAAAGEVKYLQRLVSKYGDDVEKMAKDRKLNPEQRTAGELRRGLHRAGL